MNGGKLSTFVWYFNPRSREGSDYIQGRYICACCISIHAPAKGATHSLQISPAARSDFNPRSREGSDQDLGDVVSGLAISIHAPAKGATVMRQTLGYDMTFQSTLPRRERQHLLTSFRLQYGYSLFHLTNKI